MVQMVGVAPAVWVARLERERPRRAGSGGDRGRAWPVLGAVALALGLLMPRAEGAETVVITATRSAAPAFEVPAAVSAIDADDIRTGRAQVNLSESLGSVPGLVARDRQNYAQDTQLSVRGFGARATFGIRGVRLYVDGIPATLPDGQGQISHVELGSTGRIEVLRGPYSALYGNSSGGVVQVFTDEGQGEPRAGLQMAQGSDGQRRLALSASGQVGAWSYTGSASRFTTDGYRDHSATTRRLANAKLVWRPDADRRVTLVVNSMDLPRAEDPLGLTRAQFEARPRGVDAVALSFNTRKTVNQAQAGLLVEQRLGGGHSVQAAVYGGHRGTEQVQAIAAGAQASPLHPGGVISLSRDYRGLDARWRWQGAWAGGRADAVVGWALDDLAEDRRGFQNFVGSQLGVKGALRRDERNRVRSSDPYAQASWQPAADWSVQLGLRRSSVRFESQDRFVVGANPDDSGRARYAGTLPVAGVVWAPAAALRLYASAGRGFETPTLNELSYRSSGATGLNFALQAASSRSAELGAKWRPPGWGELTAAFFQTDTEREIVTLSNSGGRAVFQNAGATQRRGAELGWAWRGHGALADLRANAAYTWLDARYREAFNTCTGTPCTVPTTVIAAGRRIPGIARQMAYASAGWLPAQGWRAGLDVRRGGAVFVNDLNSDAAAGATVLGAHLGYAVVVDCFELQAFARGDNLTQQRYAGSVIVNEGNGRFFEPAPGRTYWVGVSGSARF